MKSILGAAIGSCVHVGGLHHFLKLAEPEGYQTSSMGPAVSVERLIDAIRKNKPAIVAISYRLSPGAAIKLFEELKVSITEAGIKNLRFVFGGTPPVALAAKESGLFEMTFDGTEPVSAIKEYLRGKREEVKNGNFSDTLTGRINQKYPYPLIRHHFGRPTIEETLKGAEQIADAGILDVLSIGPDQNAQEHFFQPEEMDHSQDGAGGVPVREPGDLEAIFRMTRRGNYPLVRCYAGTRDLLKWAEMSVRTINNAWAAIPLCWYSVLDGRSTRTIAEAVRENKEVMGWYAEKDIPVEVNESHQWSLRNAHDALAVTMAFLAAYNAKRMGVRNYVSQYMFNNPPGTTAEMDIAKMLAKNEMIDELCDENFSFYREVRAGLAHFSTSPTFAQGQLAASIVVSMALKPHILHVVGFSEADHAIFPDELIHSCNIAHGVLHNTLYGMPDLTDNEPVRQRKEQLKSEALILLNALDEFGKNISDDPWSDPEVIEKAIKRGLLDAPHFQGNPHLAGNVVTNLIDGGYYAIDPSTGNKLTETQRILNTGISL